MMNEKKTEWAEEIEYVARVKEDEKDNGTFVNLMPRNYEFAKQQINGYLRLKYYILGFYEATLYRKTADYTMDEEGEKEIFKSVERFRMKSGNWEAYSVGEVERTTNMNTWRCTFKNIAG